MSEGQNISTDCAHAGEEPLGSGSTPSVMPIYQTSVYDFPDLEQVDEIFDHRKAGFIYGRYGLPNHAAFENIAAKLEQGDGAIATASGMAAIVVALWTLLQNGDGLVVANDCYGGTLGLASREFPKQGITTRFVPTTNFAALETALSPGTRVLLVETLSNPLWNVIDVSAAAEMCHRKGVKLLVDNTVATPYLIRPLTMGADMVVHSATKFLGGHHDITAGLVVGDREFISRAREVQIRTGSSLAPFDAWLAVRSWANGLRHSVRQRGELFVRHAWVQRANRYLTCVTAGEATTLTGSRAGSPTSSSRRSPPPRTIGTTCR